MCGALMNNIKNKISWRKIFYSLFILSLSSFFAYKINDFYGSFIKNIEIFPTIFTVFSGVAHVSFTSFSTDFSIHKKHYNNDPYQLDQIQKKLFAKQKILQDFNTVLFYFLMACLIFSIFCSIYLPTKNPSKLHLGISQFYVFVSCLAFGIAVYTPIFVRDLLNEQLKYRF